MGVDSHVGVLQVNLVLLGLGNIKENACRKIRFRQPE